MPKLTKISTYSLQKGVENSIPVSVPTEKAKWKDGHATNEFESVTFDVVIKDVGICQVVFPYQPDLAESLSQQVSFATPLDLNSIGNISDIQVSLYNNCLTAKILMEEFI